MPLAARAAAAPQEAYYMRRLDLPRYSSSIGKLKVHVCIKAKYCHRIFLNTAVRARCTDVFGGVFSEMGIAVDELGFDDNHVHMAFDLSPRYALWQVMKNLKGRSSRVLMQEFPHLRRDCFWGGHLWNPSYYLEGIGKDEGQMRTYVRNQPLSRPEDLHQAKITQFMPPALAGGC